MNFKKKALLPAIAMVLVSVIALSGVSYAWFTLSPKASVGELSLNVAAAQGLQISVDGVKWTSSLVADDIKPSAYTGAVNQVPAGDIVPVSSAAALADGELVIYNGTTEDGKTLTSTKATTLDGTAGNYYAFDLFFQITDASVTLQLDAGSYVKAFTNATDPQAAKTSYAARVAFVNFGAKDTAAAQYTNKTPVGDAIVWEPSATLHTDGAIANGHADGTAVAYKGINAEGTIDLTGTEGLADVTTIQPIETNQATAQATDLLTLSKGINKVRVYIWLEGQDVDCINEVSGNVLKTALNFVRAEVAGA